MESIRNSVDTWASMIYEFSGLFEQSAVEDLSHHMSVSYAQCWDLADLAAAEAVDDPLCKYAW